jgi:predicted transposase
MIRLETTEDDKARLLETMKRYNEACNFVATRAYSLKLANKYKLHKEVYHETRQRFGLSSQFVLRITEQQLTEKLLLKPEYLDFQLVLKV